MRAWTVLLIAAASGCGAAAPSAPAPTPAAPVAVALPEVPLLTVDNQATGIAALRAGKPALVSFWAPWCESCATEFDALNRLDDRARPSGGLVIGVAVGETPASAADFARRHGMRYLQAVDADFKLSDALGQRHIPVTLVVDKGGRVVFSGGALDARALAAFRAALEG